MMEYFGYATPGSSSAGINGGSGGLESSSISGNVVGIGGTIGGIGSNSGFNTLIGAGTENAIDNQDRNESGFIVYSSAEHAFVTDMINKGFSAETQANILDLSNGIVTSGYNGNYLAPGDLDVFAPESPSYVLDGSTLLSEFEENGYGDTNPGIWLDELNGQIGVMYSYINDVSGIPRISFIGLGWIRNDSGIDVPDAIPVIAGADIATDNVSSDIYSHISDSTKTTNFNKIQSGEYKSNVNNALSMLSWTTQNSERLNEIMMSEPDLSVSELADMFGVSRYIIRKKLKELDFPIIENFEMLNKSWGERREKQLEKTKEVNVCSEMVAMMVPFMIFLFVLFLVYKIFNSDK